MAHSKLLSQKAVSNSENRTLLTPRRALSSRIRYLVDAFARATTSCGCHPNVVGLNMTYSKLAEMGIHLTQVF